MEWLQNAQTNLMHWILFFFFIFSLGSDCRWILVRIPVATRLFYTVFSHKSLPRYSCCKQALRVRRANDIRNRQSYAIVSCRLGVHESVVYSFAAASSICAARNVFHRSGVCVSVCVGVNTGWKISQGVVDNNLTSKVIGDTCLVFIWSVQWVRRAKLWCYCVTILVWSCVGSVLK